MNPGVQVVIRAVEDRDCPALAALLSQSTGLETTEAQMRGRLSKSQGIEHPIVATLDDRVVGLASLRLTHCLGEDAPYAEVLELFVAPELRQHGIGAALLAQLEVRARAAGANGWNVIVGTDNEPALALYRKQGLAQFAIAMQQWFSAERPFKAPPKRSRE